MTDDAADKPSKPQPHYRVVLDLGPGELGKAGNAQRTQREVSALARAAWKVWNTRAAELLQRAAKSLEGKEAPGGNMRCVTPRADGIPDGKW